MQTVEIITIILSTISLIFSLSVVFIISYRYNNLARGKSLVQTVYIIAICDSVVSLSFAMGYPTGFGCSLQGFLAFNSERASWLWTDFLILNIYGVVMNHRLIISVTMIHMIVWPIIVIFAFIPYATGMSYGSKYPGTGRCGMVGVSTFAWGTFQNWLVVASICFILLLCLRILISKLSNDRTKESHRALSSESFRTIILYPVAMLVTWGPSQVLGVITKARYYEAFNYLHVLAPLYGLVLAIIFYSRTKYARGEWQKIFIEMKLRSGDDNDDTIDVDLKDSCISIGESVEEPVYNPKHSEMVVRIND